MMNVFYKPAQLILLLILNLSFLIGCGATPNNTSIPVQISEVKVPDYIVGPGDTLQIFVWRNPEVSTTVPVRPDGKISTPLVEDIVASGKTATKLARDIERELSVYLKDPLVTVMVSQFVGPYGEQIRVVGEATKPAVLQYRANMTLLDVMIEVGGLTDFAAGNKASIVRLIDGKQQQFNVRLDSLIREGDIKANVAMLPGDILIIPESWF